MRHFSKQALTRIVSVRKFFGIESRGVFVDGVVIVVFHVVFFFFLRCERNVSILIIFFSFFFSLFIYFLFFNEIIVQYKCLKERGFRGKRRGEKKFFFFVLAVS